MNRFRRGVLRCSLCLLFVLPSLACLAYAGKPTADSPMVDAGSFAVMRGGKRVATETFRIEQKAGASSTSTEFKLEDGKVSQNSQLDILDNGDLKHYEWKSLYPDKSDLTLEPGDQMLTEQINIPGADKPTVIPFFLPASTNVLDDYNFVQRQILVWRYLATSCAGGLKDCKLQPSKLGIIVPQQHAFESVTLAFIGREKVSLKGSDRELDRFSLKSDDAEWTLWFDPADHKLQRILIGTDNTEVLRD